ncbi:MAG: hypothetical protein Ct9H300mP1_03140 [Planctomycetaceae bacterium]|nr:MAG: hypothetical protein Ct9H300mP1_03140 [Planctomycetaceae bacterium]
MLRALGIEDRVPPRWPLKIRRLGAIEYERYRIEKFTYESYPGMAVPALLYVPRRAPERGPRGIVSIAGHAYGSGKTSDFLQRRNVNLVLRGCVVLSYDYLNTGERNTGPNAKKKCPTAVATITSSAVSPSPAAIRAGWRCWMPSAPSTCCLVVTKSIGRESVSPANRAGGTAPTGRGLSIRGSSWCFPVSSVTTFDYWIRKNRNYDWHQRPFGVRRHAGIGTLLALHAPRPLLVISSKRKNRRPRVPVGGGRTVLPFGAPHVYGLVGAKSAIAHYESPTAHGYQVDKRKQLYRWVDRWLQPPRSMGDRDLEVKVEPGTAGGRAQETRPRQPDSPGHLQPLDRLLPG